MRAGRGFSLEELKAAGINRKAALGIGIAVDHRRKNRSEEGLQLNVARLRLYKSRLVLFPRKPTSKRAKKGDSSREEQAAARQELSADVLPLRATVHEHKAKARKVTKEEREATVTAVLRKALTDSKLWGVREKRAKDKADEAAGKKAKPAAGGGGGDEGGRGVDSRMLDQRSSTRSHSSCRAEERQRGAAAVSGHRLCCVLTQVSSSPGKCCISCSASCSSLSSLTQAQSLLVFSCRPSQESCSCFVLLCLCTRQRPCGKPAPASELTQAGWSSPSLSSQPLQRKAACRASQLLSRDRAESRQRKG